MPASMASNRARKRGFARRQQIPLLITVVGVVNTSIGLVCWVCWRITGDGNWATAFFRYPNAGLTVAMGMVEFACCSYAWRQFERADSLYRAWFLLTLASGAHLTGRLLSQVVFQAASDRHTSGIVQQAGILIGGPLQMSLLLGGLACVALTCWRSGLLTRLSLPDIPLITLAGASTLHTMYEIWLFIDAGKPITWAQALAWPSDPLVVMLLLLAIVIRRSVASMGHGMIASCWRSYVIAVSLIALGDAGLWLMRTPYIPWHLTTLSWYVWFLADAAFALGPAHQVVALERARALREVLSVRKRITAA